MFTILASSTASQNYSYLRLAFYAVSLLAASIILFRAASFKKDRSARWSNKIEYRVSTFLLFLGIFTTAADQKYGAIGISIVIISLISTCLTYARQKLIQKQDKDTFWSNQIPKNNSSLNGLLTDGIDYILLFNRVIMILLSAYFFTLIIETFY